MKRATYFLILLGTGMILNACQKYREDVNDYFIQTRIDSFSKDEVGVTFTGTISSDPPRSYVEEIGICYSTSPTPNMNDRQVIGGMNKDKFSVNVEHLSFDSSYYFRSFGVNDYGHTYGNTIFIENVGPDSVEPPCNLVENTASISGLGTFTYGSQNSFLNSDGDRVYQIGINSGYKIEYTFGSAIQNSIIKTTGLLNPSEGQVRITFQNFMGIPQLVNPNTDVYVKWLSEGLYEVTVCDGTWNSNGTSYGFKSRVKISK